VRYLRVKRIIDMHYPTISPNDLATHARALMRDLGLSVIPVVSESKILGIVKRYNVLMLTSTKSNALVNDIMENPQLVFNDNDDLKKAVKIMIEFDEWHAPVTDSRSGKYLGMISLSSYMRALGRSYLSLSNKVMIENIMTKEVEYVLPDDHISRLWRKMVTLRISGFPVVRSKKTLEVIGMITQHDLLRKGYTRIELESERGPKKGVKVRDAMTTPAVTLKPYDTLDKALTIMIEKDIGRIPVVDHEGKLKGIIDRSDVCMELIKLR